MPNETFTWAIYQQYQSAFDRSMAAVLSLVLVALAVGILLMEAILREKKITAVFVIHGRGEADRGAEPRRLSWA